MTDFLPAAAAHVVRIVLVADPGVASEIAQELADKLPHHLMRQVRADVDWRVTARTVPLVADEQLDVSSAADVVRPCEVVDDGEGQQERAQGGRQVGGEDREDREDEGDIGGHRHRPPVQAPAACRGDHAIQGGRHGHSAHRGDHRQCRGRGSAQLADDQFTLELDPGDQEEHREQTVRRPVPHRQVQAECRYPEVDIPYLLVRPAPRAVRPHQRHYRGGKEYQATDGLGAQCTREGLTLGQR